MSIAFDTKTDGADNGGLLNSVGWNHTVTPGGLNRILIVGIIGANVTDGLDFMTVTYAGAGMTNLGVAAPITGPARRVWLYYLISPATGTNAVVVTASSVHYLGGCSTSYTGVNPSGQPDDIGSQSQGVGATSLTLALPTTADNCWMVLFGGGFDANKPSAAGAGSTRRGFDHTAGLFAMYDSGGLITPPSSYSMTYTYPDPNTEKMVGFGITLAPAPGGGGGGSNVNEGVLDTRRLNISGNIINIR